MRLLGGLFSLAAGIAQAADSRVTGPDGQTQYYIEDRGTERVIRAPDGKILGYADERRVTAPDGRTLYYLDDPDPNPRPEPKYRKR